MNQRGFRVLMAGPYPLWPGKIVGGVEAVTNALAPALAQNTWIEHITMVCFFHENQIQPHTVHINDRFQVVYLKGQRFKTLTRSALEVLQIRRLARQVRANIVHGHGLLGMGYAATMASVASAVTVHGMVQKEYRMGSTGNLKDRLKIALVESNVKAVLHRADLMISISEYDAQELRPLIENIHVTIPNPIESIFFQPHLAKAQTGRILFAGVARPRKNVVGLVRAFAAVHQQESTARLILVGPSPDPEYMAEIQQAIQQLQLGDVVEIVGHVENERLIEEVHRCSVLALFSNEETAPTIISQAMAVGRAVVATRVGGIAEMVSDGESGFLVDKGDEQALADRLTTLLHNPEQARRMGERGNELARQRYEPSAVAQQTVEAYRRIV